MAKKSTRQTTNRGGSAEPRSGAARRNGARLGDCVSDDIFISDRVAGEVAEYRAAMTAALRRRMLTTLRIPLKKAVHAVGAIRVAVADR